MSSFKNQLGDRYTTAMGYKMFVGSPQRLQWSSQVWNRWNYPKHSFILWLAWQNRLTTKGRLMKYCTIADVNCIFCLKQVEDIDHLFFRCQWTCDCLLRVQGWLDR